MVFGWVVPPAFEHFQVYDFRNMDEVALRNAVATAEGTLAEAIKHGSINITGSRCLVLGYGRCGREIASLFRAVRAYVTVADRNNNKREDVAFHGMDVCGDEACELKMKEINGTKSRCILENEKIDDKCIVCGKPAKDLVVWGIQY